MTQFLFFLNFKKKKSDIIKNNNPKILLSGHMAVDLIIGEIKKTQLIKKRNFFSTLLNLVIKHLYEKKIIRGNK